MSNISLMSGDWVCIFEFIPYIYTPFISFEELTNYWCWLQCQWSENTKSDFCTTPLLTSPKSKLKHAITSALLPLSFSSWRVCSVAFLFEVCSAQLILNLRRQKKVRLTHTYFSFIRQPHILLFSWTSYLLWIAPIRRDHTSFVIWLKSTVKRNEKYLPCCSAASYSAY